jgi:hypothetical protein
MKTDYSRGEVFLHKIALSSRATKTLLFDLEKQFFLKERPDPDRHLFICGLARAGTTALLNALHQTGAYASPTFEDMPFVLSPNLWNRISGKFSRSTQATERAHGDGMQISSTSPEALDEIFWSLSTSYESFSDGSAVMPYDPGGDALAEFENFAALYCRRYGKDRYLSKNNNNIFRLDCLAERFPGAAFLMPFRTPEQQAYSLYSQHRNFLKTDAFQQAYMTWLGHFEFGNTHRPYRFPQSVVTGLKPHSPDYWLNTWFETYRYALSVARQRGNVVPVCYELYSGRRDAYLDSLSRACGADLQGARFVQSIKDHQCDFDAGLTAKCEALYRELERLSLDRLAAAV